MECRKLFYGRKIGRKLSSAKVKILDNGLKNNTIKSIKNWDKAVLEIGGGDGEFISFSAENRPHISHLEVEPFINGAVKVFENIQKKGLQNLACENDIFQNVQEKLPTVFKEIYILYPDPWHKKRHNKRRWINGVLLLFLSSRLVSGGKIIIRTDHPSLVKFFETELKKVNLSFVRGEDHLPNILKDFLKIYNTKYGRKNMSSSKKDFSFVIYKD
ncbi:MAG: hypothetical protein JJV93_01550 [Alphaproteobacteria bacterium]|nr:hypothetical protein [Alphaproteobacteria bacterium]MBL0717933.1 hypothetical protein [Alphaproteobacteria bacterium]